MNHLSLLCNLRKFDHSKQFSHGNSGQEEVSDDMLGD